MTDIAAAIGIHQLARAEEMRRAREAIAHRYLISFADVEQMQLPPTDSNILHAWHLFPIKLCLDKLSVTRDAFVEQLRSRGINFSVHWRPLHLHPYYQSGFGWRPEDCPVATRTWKGLVSLPIFSGMSDDEVEDVIEAVKSLCASYSQNIGEPLLVGA
jgi:perosamine synthetase